MPSDREELAEAIIDAWQATGDAAAIAQHVRLPKSDIDHVIRTGRFPADQLELAFKQK